MSLRFLKQRRAREAGEPLEDPLAGVANLFDASVVFIVSMMIALFVAHDMLDMMNPQTEVTITKKTSDGSLEIISRKGTEVKVQKVTDQKMGGTGSKLGTAYRLQDGRVVYVPD